jgi:uncharacterized protein YegL
MAIMSERPGASLTQRPLHFFVVADCSGSMAAQGKMQALNVAMREMLPHLVDVAEQNPHARVLLRSIAFSTGARWHIEAPVSAAEMTWSDLDAGGYTDLGAALDLLADALSSPPMESRALPPAVVLISDGMPTDEWEAGLGRLLGQPWGQRSVRMSVGIGREADHDVLQRFMGDSELSPLSAHNPEQLVSMIRWASTHASRVASTLNDQQTELPDMTVSEKVW